MPSTRIAIAVSISIVMPSLAAAQTVPEEYTTAKGEKVMLPPITEMECAEIDSVLTNIDGTGYRANAPEPHDEADKPLFEYETELAREHYTNCVMLQKNYSGGLLLMPRAKLK